MNPVEWLLYAAAVNVTVRAKVQGLPWLQKSKAVGAAYEIVKHAHDAVQVPAPSPAYFS